VRLRADDTDLDLDPADGGRITSLRLHGTQVLGGAGERTFQYGCFVMAPYAGRVRDGRFDYDGLPRTLPLTLGRHAGHGTVLEQPWRVDDRGPSWALLSCDLGPSWPWSGTVAHRVELAHDSLRLTLRMQSEEDTFPAMLGWHPWFRRRLCDGGAGAEIDLRAASMAQRDAAGIPTGRRVTPPDPPWDDAFTDVAWPISLTWPGRLQIEIDSDCPWAVVYNEDPRAVCVEPQTGPPDQFNATPRLVGPAEPLTAWSTWRWRAGPTEDVDRTQDDPTEEGQAGYSGARSGYMRR